MGPQRHPLDRPALLTKPNMGSTDPIFSQHQVKQAAAEQEASWRALVGQLQAENEACTTRAAGMLRPDQVQGVLDCCGMFVYGGFPPLRRWDGAGPTDRPIRTLFIFIFETQVPEDCKGKLKPKLHSRLYAPSQREQAEAKMQDAEPLADDEADEEEEEEPAVECSVDDAAAGKRLAELQQATGYHVLASMELEPVLDAFLSHMVPIEREEVGGVGGGFGCMYVLFCLRGSTHTHTCKPNGHDTNDIHRRQMKKKALLVGNKVGNKRDKTLVAEAIPFEDSLKCHSLGVVMTRA